MTTYRWQDPRPPAAAEMHRRWFRREEPREWQAFGGRDRWLNDRIGWGLRLPLPQSGEPDPAARGTQARVPQR